MTHASRNRVFDTEQEIQDGVLKTEDHEHLEEEWDTSDVRVTYSDVTCFVAEWD